MFLDKLAHVELVLQAVGQYDPAARLNRGEVLSLGGNVTGRD